MQELQRRIGFSIGFICFGTIWRTRSQQLVVFHCWFSFECIVKNRILLIRYITYSVCHVIQNRIKPPNHFLNLQSNCPHAFYVLLWKTNIRKCEDWFKIWPKRKQLGREHQNIVENFGEHFAFLWHNICKLYLHVLNRIYMYSNKLNGCYRLQSPLNFFKNELKIHFDLFPKC